MFENNDAEFADVEKIAEDSINNYADNDPLILSPDKSKHTNAVSIDGMRYDFHTFDLRSELRQYRSMSTFASPQSAAKMAHIEKIKNIAEQLRETKDMSAIMSNVPSAQLDNSLRKMYTSNYYNHMGDPLLESADSILFVECLKKQVVPFQIKDFVHSSNYKILFESKKKPLLAEDSDTRDSSVNESQGADDSVVEDDDDEEKVACAVENNQVISIDIGNKGIANGRGACLAESLKYCRSLLSINVSGNRLGDQTLSAILNALCLSTKCINFDISNNGFGSNSLKALVSCIKVFYSLHFRL